MMPSKKVIAAGAVLLFGGAALLYRPKRDDDDLGEGKVKGKGGSKTPSGGGGSKTPSSGGGSKTPSSEGVDLYTDDQIDSIFRKNEVRLVKSDHGFFAVGTDLDLYAAGKNYGAADESDTRQKLVEWLQVPVPAQILDNTVDRLYRRLARMNYLAEINLAESPIGESFTIEDVIAREY